MSFWQNSDAGNLFRGSMALDAAYEKAAPRPRSHDELVQLQRIAS